MSKYQAQTFSPMGQGQNALRAQQLTRRWMHIQGKLCWKCQKESIPEKGCVMSFKVGIHKYVCKACVDTRETNKC